MSVSRSEVEDYIQDIRNCIDANNYRFDMRRSKNMTLFTDYVINEAEALVVCKELSSDDFIDKVQNEHLGYEHEYLYIFGKSLNLLERFSSNEVKVDLYIKFNKIQDNQGNGYAIIVSFHEQEYSVQYYKDKYPAF